MKCFGDECRMVRLHVVDYQIVGLASGEGLVQAGEPLLAFAGVGGVENGYLGVTDKVGVVRHSFRHYILTFKQIDIQIV